MTTIHGVGPEDLWVLGNNGDVYQWDGAQFASRRTDLHRGVGFSAVHAVSDALVFVGGRRQNYLPAPVFAADIGPITRWREITAACFHNQNNCVGEEVGGYTLGGLWAPPDDPSDVWGVSGTKVIRIAAGEAPPVQGDMAEQPLFQVPALNAIWGRSSDDVWVVGDQGTAHRWDGEDWTKDDDGVDARNHLRSVTGDADRVWAVGGAPPAIFVWNFFGDAGWLPIPGEDIDVNAVDEDGEVVQGVDFIGGGIAAPEIHAIHSVPGSKDVWAVGAQRSILRWRWPD